MVQNVIPAYAYQEYSDDDDIQAFFSAINAMGQAYLEWFNEVALPYYPGLSGALLDWVGANLYGQPRNTQLQAEVGASVGPLGTVLLGTEVLGYYQFPTITYYMVTDDLYQRILTWNLYKGDGKRFCMRWLKRRVARFIFGVNGIDPNPASDNFVVGAENTSAISVQVSSGTLTVQINQALASSLVQLTPNILTLFNLAFMGGLLDLPAQYSYSVSINTNLLAIITPAQLQVTGTTANLTTGTATVTLSNGSGAYTYAWSMASEIGTVVINSPTAASTTFSGNGLIQGQGVSGIAQCVVTDTGTSNTATATIPIVIARAVAPSVVIQPGSVTATGAGDNIVTALVNVVLTGGTAPFTYAWTFTVGGVDLEISAPTASQTTFQGVNVPLGATASGTAHCLVTDFFGLTASATCAVSVVRANLPTVTLSPAVLTVAGATASLSTGVLTANAANGHPPYTYAWTWQSGGAGITINSTSAQSTSFSTTTLEPGQTFTGIVRCRVTDSFGQQVIATEQITLSRVSTLTLSATPANAISSGIASSQSAGPVTVLVAGGQSPYTYAWHWLQNAGLTISTPSADKTVFNGSGLVNGTIYQGQAQCVVTDFYGQAATIPVNVTIACNSTTYTYANQAASVFTVPNNTSTMVIEVWGPGGYGGAGRTGNEGEGFGGGGGGAGGYLRKTIAITPTNWGKTLNIGTTVADKPSVAVLSGTFTIPALTATIGANGAASAAGRPSAAGGAGGTATGGDVNTQGGSGTAGDISGPGDGGVPVTGVNGGPYGAGGLGGVNTTPGGAGGYAGIVLKLT